MVSLITTLEIILRQWRTVKRPDIRESVDAMVETVSYESMLNRLKGNMEDGITSWDHFWTHIKTDEDPRIQE